MPVRALASWRCAAGAPKAGRKAVRCSAAPARANAGAPSQGARPLLGGRSVQARQTLYTPRKDLVVAVDIDEVLGAFLVAMNKYCAEELGLHYTLRDYHAYNFASVWRCDAAEANDRVHRFFKSPHFRALAPLPGARSSLQRLQSVADLVVVTSRQLLIEQETRDWLAEHFPGVFKAVFLGNHFALSGASRSKAELCREAGATILVDDNPVYARECADAGIDVLQFNLAGNYAWGGKREDDAHPRITHVRSWIEAEVAINVRAASRGAQTAR